MTRKQLPFFIGFFVLMFGAMACACLGSGVGVGGFTATANAALTQAASSAATAESQGSSLSGTASAVGGSAEATANAEATQAIATANAASGGSVQATATTGSTGGQPTAAATTAGSGGASGGPSDIPIVQGQNTILLINAQLVSYQTKVDYATTVKFYKDQMPKNGWTEDTTTSVETANATVLAYSKDSRKAQVAISTDPSSGQTVVLVTLQ